MDADSSSILTIVAASVLVLILPGYDWLSWLSPLKKDVAGRLAMAIGLSLALNALLAEGLFFLGIDVSAESLVAIYTLLGILALISIGLALRKLYYRRQVQNRRIEGNPPDGILEPPWWRTPHFLSLVILIGFGALILWRMVQAAGLPLPPWVDSLHHVLIVRLVLENGGLPANFEPYMPVPFYYHFGFHINAALFSFWSRLPAEQAVLVLGQILNAAVALSVYQLGKAFWSDWRRAAIAGLIVGFVSQMPAYYLTWGRYTLLAGLVILPLAMATTVELLRFGWRRERVARLAVLTGGLILSHYIAALFLAAFIVIALVYSFITRRYLEAKTGWSGAWFGVIGGPAAGFVLAIPWIARTWEFARAYTTVINVPLDAALDTVYFSGYLSYLGFLLGPDRNYLLIALAVVGLVVGGWRRRSIPLVAWSLVLLLLSSPWGPKVNPLRPDHAVIVLFIPVALLIADGFAVIWDWFGARGWGRAAGWATGIILLLLVGWGLWDTQVITNPITLLVDPVEMQAIDWVEANTPEEARFFINTIHWQNGVYRGVDGGWWILPLTGRPTLIPPTMYLLGDREYVLQLNSWGERAAQLQGCTEEMWGLFSEARIEYVYLRKGAGALQPMDLEACEGLEEVYARDGGFIYRVTDTN